MQFTRKARERGEVSFDWLQSQHTFSFGSYYDPAHMGFGSLRVINEDIVQPSRGFDTHGHEHMEIISYVLEGAMVHEDSLGNGSVIRPGEIQRMTAGTGVRHSEFNASATEPLRFLQIWILPDSRDLEPGYEQKAYSANEQYNTLKLVGSKDARDNSVTIHQDVDFFVTKLGDNVAVSHQLQPGRIAWIQIVQGGTCVNGSPVNAGDGIAIDTPGTINLRSANGAEVLLFDMLSPA